MRYKRGMFKGKRVTAMGLGVLGRGVGDIEFLAREGAEIIVTDLKPKKHFADVLKRLKRFKNITYVFGEHRFKDFENRDFILKAASVPLDSAHIAHARAHGVPVYMSTALCAWLAPVRTIGVTGTRGKTTVTHMIYEGLKRAKKGRVFLGGNVRGVSTLAMLPKMKRGDTIVLELDSWQLQGFGDLKISPNVAVFTTFMPDHLNYYKGDLKAYFGDKANIFLNQRKGDICIVGRQVKEQKRLKLPLAARVVSASDLPSGLALLTPGEHNRYNAALAYAALESLGVPKRFIKESLERFRGVSGRLERLGVIKGVTVYNDTTATTPHALATALAAVEAQRVVLIAGGSDKQIDLKILKPVLKKCKAIILLPGTGTDRLIEEKMVPSYTRVKNMRGAVREAFKHAEKGEAILLSPGFTSFGLFKNEYDRGDKFLAEVKKYQKRK